MYVRFKLIGIFSPIVFGCATTKYPSLNRSIIMTVITEISGWLIISGEFPFGGCPLKSVVCRRKFETFITEKDSNIQIFKKVTDTHHASQMEKVFKVLKNTLGRSAMRRKSTIWLRIPYIQQHRELMRYTMQKWTKNKPFLQSSKRTHFLESSFRPFHHFHLIK